MTKSAAVNLALGAALGYSHILILTLVIAVPVFPSKFYVESLWAGILVDSAISVLATSLLLGAIVGIAIRRFVSLAPLAVALGFVIGAVISLVPLDWMEVENTLGRGLIALRIGEVFVGAGLLMSVWWYVGRREI
jgi:hypothetical protein